MHDWRSHNSMLEQRLTTLSGPFGMIRNKERDRLNASKTNKQINDNNEQIQQNVFPLCCCMRKRRSKIFVLSETDGQTNKPKHMQACTCATHCIVHILCTNFECCQTCQTSSHSCSSDIWNLEFFFSLGETEVRCAASSRAEAAQESDI